MASNPPFHVDKFTTGIPAEEFKTLTDPAQHYPLINRAVQGLYAPGSTFKLFTVDRRASTPTASLTPRGSRSTTTASSSSAAANKQRFFNASTRRNGIVDLKRALTVSSDVFFYNVGFLYWQQYGTDDQSTDLDKKLYGIQRVARSFGFGTADRRRACRARPGAASPTSRSSRISTRATPTGRRRSGSRVTA